MFMSYEKLAQADLVKYFQICFQAVLKAVHHFQMCVVFSSC